MALLVSERWAFFQEAVDVVFTKWTALQIGIDNSPYPGQTPQKDLVEDTVEFFKEYNGQIHADELASNFDRFLEEQLDCYCEDNSPYQVSTHLLKLFAEIIGNSDLTTLQVMKEELSKRGREVVSKVVADEGASDSEMEDESMDVEMQADTPVYTKPEPIIDEDGFELVVRKKKGRK
ncbi:hypothetical protein HDV01_003158 [Terramyces sp. JEL0728]|nr:hypothetical protein HDV01_003151 [Terramyces sp. JEL0728]KAJ3274314.1 hypothetical protein HDV01_003158 [Terramyces sp. JEL0728]